MLSKKLSETATEWVQSNPHLSVKQHQLSGIEWCLNRELDEEHSGGILADEMGLGKTILMIATMVANPKPHTLIVVPPALLDQWKNAIELFAPEILIPKGIASCRETFETPIFRTNKYTDISERNKTGSKYDFYDLGGYKIWLVSYGLISIRKNEKWCSPLWKNSIEKSCKKTNLSIWEWDRIVYDEAHHMRNKKSNTYKGCVQLGGQIKWFVTGTPIQNYEKDYHSLLSQLNVLREYSIEPDATTKKYVLARTKQGVGIKMPEKTLKIENVCLNPTNNLKEYNLVTQIHNHLNLQDVTLENVDRIIADMFEGKGFSLYTAARQSCIMPELITKRALRFALTAGIHFEDELVEGVITHTKLTAISEHIKTNIQNGSKLVFTHYRTELDRLEILLKQQNVNVAKLDGRTANKNRNYILSGSDRLIQLILNRRIRMPDVQKKILSYITPDVLLIQIKSGCEGLNLQAYNEVYFTSPHWNPAVEDQAIARAHRIGQTRSVNVYRFITKLAGENTTSLDEYCLAVQEKKRELMEKLASVAQQ